MKTILVEDDATEVGVRLGYEPLAFCLENNYELGEGSWVGRPTLEVASVVLVKDAP